ncbi:MAG TPA: hypothetical protein PLV56_06550, partial [Synergistales bacterium]|nr:hypothetical protein [Synergistales bacterium]
LGKRNEIMKKYFYLVSFVIAIIALLTVQSIGLSSAEETYPVKPFDSREMALVNGLVKDMNSVVEEITIAIERNPNFRDPVAYPQQLGELIVRSKTVFSRAEEIVQEGETYNLQEGILQSLVSARDAMEELHKYLLGLIDGRSNEAQWQSYQAGVAEFLDFKKEMEEANAALALEKGLVFDYLAELKTKLNPILSANEEFLELIDLGEDRGKAYIAAKNVFEENTKAFRIIRDISIPIDVSGRTYEELMQCSNCFADHFTYMRRAAALFVKSLDAEKDLLKKEISYFVDKATEMRSLGEKFIRFIKDEF